MYPNAFIEEISVINFRNHKNFLINNLKPFVVLNGENGSGKTNILEAISLFSPGKGPVSYTHLTLPTICSV